MSEARDVVVIGGGHNGLVAACLLARGGRKVTVLERRAIVGGACVTEDLGSGFRCPTLAHTAGPLMPGLIEELGLARHGLEMIRPDVRVFAPPAGGRGQGLVIYQDPARTASELKGLSAKDAARYPEFHETFAKLGRFLRPVLAMTPPSIEAPSTGEMWSMLKLGRAFRSLGRRDAYRLLRWGPMAVADLAAEWFETELLRAVVSARGIYGSFAGPWSAGTSVPLLFSAAVDGSAMPPSATFQGGIGALTQALAAAARAAGVEIRTEAETARINVAGDRAESVTLAGGEEIAARCIVSNADPKTTFLKLIDPTALTPDFLLKMNNYRCLGMVAKVNYALSGLPAFGGGAADGRTLAGRIHIGPEVDSLERAFDAAKYGGISQDPYLDITIPSIADPSLAPKGAHVMSVVVQFAPFRLKTGDWASRRDELGAIVDRTLAAYAPNLGSLVVGRQVITPADLETTYGLSGGHIFHGEQSLDQIFTMRPLLGWARHATPIRGLFLCGAGTHPGGGVTGGPGAGAAREILKTS